MNNDSDNRPAERVEMIEPKVLNEWLAIPVEELAGRSPVPVRVLPTKEDVHRDFADTMFREIQNARAEGRELPLIVPVGPTGQYPVLAERINEAGLSLDHVTFFGMDDWLDWQGRPIPPEDSQSLQGTFRRVFLDKVSPHLRPAAAKVIFPTPFDLEQSTREIERMGGV